MKSNNCSCHISLSEYKVKLHVLTVQSSSAASGALMYRRHNFNKRVAAVKLIPFVYLVP